MGSVGSYYGKYFLLKKIAAGGMGEIFLAKQQGPAGYEKILVIKRILGHLAEDKTFVESFLGEAKLTARMSHRNIVQIYDLGEHDDGSYFIAMEYVQGKPLRDVLDAAWAKGEKMHPALVKDVIMQCAEGLSYAHNMTDLAGRPLNLIHRDVNPQNLLVSYSGDVKIIDFGIAKSEMSVVKTEAGMIKGKFVYMSPEQSQAKKLDKRSDIFAVGIMMYECLCGLNPFQKDNVVLSLEAIQRLDPAPPSEFDPSYAVFDPIVARALAKNRDERYADCMDLRDDLARINVPPPPERLGQWVSRLFRQQLEEEQKILLETDVGEAQGGDEGGQAEGGEVAETGTVVMDTRGRIHSGKGKAHTTSGPHTKPVTGQRKAQTGQRKVEPPAEEPAVGSTQIANPELLRQVALEAAKAAQQPKSSAGLVIGLVVGLLLLGGVGAGGFYLWKNQQEAKAEEIKPAQPQKTPEELAAEARQKAKEESRAKCQADPKMKFVDNGDTWECKLDEAKALAEAKSACEAQGKEFKQTSPSGGECREKQVAAVTPPPSSGGGGGGGKSAGQLKVGALPRTSLVVDGKDKGMTGQKVSLKKSGSIEVGNDESPWKVSADYEAGGDCVSLDVSTEPWAILYVNNLSRGKTPVNGLKVCDEAVRIDLKKPGSDNSMTLILNYESN